MRKTLIISALSLLSSVFLAAQYGGDKSNTIPASGANVYTKVQALSEGGGASCSPTCTFTIPSTGSGNLGYAVFSSTSNQAFYATAVSGAGTFVCPSAAQSFQSFFSSASACYTLSTTPSATSLSVTFNNNGTYGLVWFEFSSTSAPTFDVCGHTSNLGSSTNQPGVTLSLAGSTGELIIQGIVGGSSSALPSSVASPFALASGASAQGGAGAWATGQSSGTPPSNLWTYGSAQSANTNGCAFK